MRRPFRSLLFAGLLFVASGTLLSASNDSSDQHAVESALKKHVSAGVTRADQIIQRFGQPASREALRGPGESAVLGYHHRAVVAPPGLALTPLLPHAAPADTFFEVSDGVVTRYWTSM